MNRPSRLACSATMCVLAIVLLSGCEYIKTDWSRFLDPSAVITAPNKNLTNPIYTTASSADEHQELPPGAMYPTQEDLTYSILEYTLGPNDAVEVDILDLFAIGQEAPVRRQVTGDGYIDIPLVPERIKAAGLTREQLREAVVQALIKADILQSPQVSVTILSQTQNTYNVLGAVTAPGPYTLIKPDMRLLDALAAARSISTTNLTYIYVIRPAPVTKAGGEQQPKAPAGEGPSPETTTDPILGPLPEIPLELEPSTATAPGDDIESGGLVLPTEALPSDDTEPDPATESVPDVEPAPATESVFDTESAPATEAVLDTESAPATESAPSAESVPAGEFEPATSESTLEEPAPELPGLTQPAADTEPAPATETSPASEPNLDEMNNLMPGPRPATTPVSARKVAPDVTASLARLRMGRPVLADEFGGVAPAGAPGHSAQTRGGFDSTESQPASKPSAKDPFGWNRAGGPGGGRIIAIDLKKLQEGNELMNIVIRSNDTIYVPLMDRAYFYVTGEVARPGPYDLTGQKLTVKQAMAAAGGPGPLAWPSNSILIRRIGESQEQMIPINIERIFHGDDPDLFLKSNDIIAVGTHAAAQFMAVLRNAFRATYGYGFIWDRNFADPLFGTDFIDSTRFTRW